MFSLEKLWLSVLDGPRQAFKDIYVWRMPRSMLGKEIKVTVEYETDEPPSGTIALRVTHSQTATDYAVSETPAYPVTARGTVSVMVAPTTFSQLNLMVLHNGEMIAGNGMPLQEKPEPAP